MKNSGLESINKKSDLVASHLPTCHEGYSTLPNVFSGNGIFGAIGGRSKPKVQTLYSDNVKIPTPSKLYEIYFKGEPLAQSDLTIYLRIISMYGIGQTMLGENIWIKLHEFLTEEQASAPSHAYERFEATIRRLYNKEIVIIRPNMPPFYCRLVSGHTPIFIGSGNRKMLEISIDPTLREAFKIDGYSFICLSERFRLGNNQLALWLHIYYARHAKPHPVSAKFIYENSASRAKDFKRWVRCTLAPAVEKFNPLHGWFLHLNLSKGYDEAKLYCQKPVTSSQQRYLDKLGVKVE